MTEFRTQDLSWDLPALEFLLFATLISSLTFLSLLVGKIGRSSISLILLLQTFKHVNVYYYYPACTQNLQKWGAWGLLWVERVRKNTMAKEKKLRHEPSNLFQRSREWSWSVGKKTHLLAATGVRQAVWEAKERVDREARYLDSQTPGWNTWGEKKKQGEKKFSNQIVTES